jgi:hypothetical protein
MKLKSLLFGSAAVMAVGTAGAQAADLPTVEPVEYVRICDAFGTGFYYIPGTDTCLKISGYVRVDSAYVGGSDEDISLRYGGYENIGEQGEYLSEAYFNHYYSYARGHISLDARTQTDIGMVRAYIAYNMTNSGVDFGDSNDGSASLDTAFIQVSNDWGTLTVGRTGSFFDFWGSDGYGDRINIDDSTQGSTNLAAWTFAGGNGFSFTIAAEDPASNGRVDEPGYYMGYGYYSGPNYYYYYYKDQYEGHNMPDGVANIRVDQAWGSAQVMAAVHPIHDYNGYCSYPYGCYYDSGSDDYALGWAIGAGLSLGIPGGWHFNAQGGYADGALKYVTSDPGVGGGQFGSYYAAVALNYAGFHAGDFLGPNADDTNKAWNIRAGISGPLGSPNLTVWLNGSYTRINGQKTGYMGQYCWYSSGCTITDDPIDHDHVAIVAGAAYELAPGLTAGPEVAWEHEDWDNVPYDYDIWGVMWRMQRSF